MFEQYISENKATIDFLDQSVALLKELGEKTLARHIGQSLDELKRGRFNLTLVGGFNRGKSTLLNALMRQRNDDLSPISFTACTSVIIKYMDRSLSPDGRSKAVVSFAPHGADQAHVTSEIRLSELRDYATEGGNPQNSKNVESIEVYGEYPSWSKAMNIVDSPGQNSVYGHHDELLRHFLPTSDAIVFLIAADLPLDGGDLELLTQIAERDQRKVFFVLSKVDELDSPEEVDEMKAYIQSQVRASGLQCGKIYPISAHSVYELLVTESDDGMLEQQLQCSGMRELEKDLEEFILANSAEPQLIKQRLASLVEQATEALARNKEQHAKVLSGKVDPDQLREEQQQLEALSQELEGEMRASLARVDRDWKQLLMSFSTEFHAYRPSMETSIVAELEQDGLFAAFNKQGKLNDCVSRAIGVHLAPMLYQLNERVDTILAPLSSIDMKVAGVLSGNLLSSLPLSAASPVESASTPSWDASVVGLASQASAKYAEVKNVGNAIKAIPFVEQALNSSMVQKAKDVISGKETKTTQQTEKGTKTAPQTEKGTSILALANTATRAVPAVVIAATVVTVVGYFGKKWRVSQNIDEAKVVLTKLLAEAGEKILAQMNTMKDNFSINYRSQMQDRLKEHAQRIEKLKQLVVNFDENSMVKLKGDIETIQHMLDRKPSILQQLHETKS